MAVSETGHLASNVRKFAKSLGGQFRLVAVSHSENGAQNRGSQGERIRHLPAIY